ERGATGPFNARLYVYTVLGASNWVYKWYRPSGPQTPAELGAEIADVLLATIGPLTRPSPARARGSCGRPSDCPRCRTLPRTGHARDRGRPSAAGTGPRRRPAW